MEKLFSYGTLQQTNVQLSTFGRELLGTKDILVGYVISTLKITDEHVVKTSGKNVHPILTFTGNNNDEVIGTVFEISDDELAQADKYEVKEYTRIAAVLKSGVKTWIYAAAK
jgi:gamma-glutamylcyclotransferase (GGCT)/AIG2-like uncharacterized protein YtfP